MKPVSINSFLDIGKMIEETAEFHGIGYIDSAIDYCDKNGLEYEFIGEIIAQNPNLKTKLAMEAENLNFIRREDKLPL